MRILFTLLLLIASLAGHAARAEEFYVELGRAPTEEEAKLAWSALQEQYGFLADYDVYPNKILQFDGDAVYRVQAGPMLDKREANRICRKLFTKNISCFVIEGFDPKNTPTFAANEPPPSNTAEPDLVLPWSVSSTTTASQGKVEVAEAIPVAVTEEDNQVTIDAPLVVSSAPSVETNNSLFGSMFSRSGWLSVQPFLDESRAKKFWRTLQKKAPETASLTMQMIHPVVSHDVPKVILSIGQFASEEEAMQFCRRHIQGELECQFATEPPQGEAASGLVSQKVASDEYSLFWVEVLNHKDQEKLLEQWERVRTDNDDLLADQRSQITNSLDKPNVYVVRVGPLKTRSKATKLCTSLKGRGLGCKLVSL